MKLKLVDMHAHTSGISRCCRISGKDLVKLNKDFGIDGFILTNHYSKDVFNFDDPLELPKRFLKEFYEVKKYGEEIGEKVFFGVEITMHNERSAHMLVYGVGDEFVLNNPYMFNYSLKQLREEVDKYGGYLVQAHPYRNNIDALLDVSLLDGVEVNCHSNTGNNLKEMNSIAKENNILLTCGGDFHHDSPRLLCGVYLPIDEFEETEDIIKYLLNAKEYTLCVTDPEWPDSKAYEHKFVK
jgi:predicted metal-dependent phosphoesterase TrpH